MIKPSLPPARAVLLVLRRSREGVDGSKLLADVALWWSGDNPKEPVRQLLEELTVGMLKDTGGMLLMQLLRRIFPDRDDTDRLLLWLATLRQDKSQDSGMRLHDMAQRVLDGKVTIKCFLPRELREAA